MKDMAQVLHSLKDTLKDDQKWMDKYNSLEAIPEDGAEKVTEGRIEVLEYVIKQIEDALYENVQVTKHMSIKQKRDDAKLAVTTLRDYLITGKRDIENKND